MAVIVGSDPWVTSFLPDLGKSPWISNGIWQSHFQFCIFFVRNNFLYLVNTKKTLLKCLAKSKARKSLNGSFSKTSGNTIMEISQPCDILIPRRWYETCPITFECPPSHPWAIHKPTSWVTLAQLSQKCHQRQAQQSQHPQSQGGGKSPAFRILKETLSLELYIQQHNLCSAKAYIVPQQHQKDEHLYKGLCSCPC